MKRYILIIASVVLFQQAYSQSAALASNFGLVSESGDTLYLDTLLNQDKAVLLVFFGYNCVYCQLDVPEINNIYNNYGQNQNDLYVWAIENNTFADYSDVNQFETDYQTDYECWNATSSDSVSQLFSVNYTPYYYVICPDRTYNNFDLDTVPDVIDACLGITELEGQQLSQPVISYFDNSLKINSAGDKRYDLNIYNISGQLIRKEKIKTGEVISFNRHAGIYFYSLRSKDERIRGKIFVNN